MKRFLPIALALALCLCFASSASAQGGFAHDIAWRFTPAGAFPAGGTTITVCTSGSAGTPCTPTVTIYQDAALSVSVANPLAICSSSNQIGCVDGMGNFSFYATAGSYAYTVTGAGVVPYGPYPILAIVPTGGGSGGVPIYTVATLPSGQLAGTVVSVKDGISSVDCSVGGGSTPSICSYTGSAWVPQTAGASLSADNNWTANQRFKGPIPWRDFTAYMPAGGCSSLYNEDPVATGTMSSGSPNLATSNASDYKNGCGVAVIGAGPTATIATASSVTGTAARDSANCIANVTSPTYCVELTASGSNLVPGIGNGSDFAGLITVTGCSDSNFNTTTTGWLLNFGTPVTSFLYKTSGSSGTSATGCAASFLAGWAHGIVGSTTWDYKVAPIDAHGGVGAAVGPITITNGNATLSTSNYNWIGYQATSGAREFAIYRDVAGNGVYSCIGTSFSQGYSDWGLALPAGCPAYVPSTPPSSPTAQTLNTTIVSGGGTTSLVLAANASNNATSQPVYDDTSMFLADCINDVITDQEGAAPTYLLSGSYGCYIPYGFYAMNGDMPTDTISVGNSHGVSIRVAGTLMFQSWPWAVRAGYSILGEGNSGGVATSQSFPTTLIYRGERMPAGFVLRGSGIDIENFSLDNMIGDGVFISSDPSTNAGASGITMNNMVLNVQDPIGVGVPLVLDGNSLFMNFNNMIFIPRTAGFPASILFTETGYQGNGHADIFFNNIFTQYHHIVIDSPGGQNCGQGTSFTQTGFWTSEEHGSATTGGLIHLDTGLTNGAVGACSSAAQLASATVSNMQNADASNKDGFTWSGQNVASFGTVVLSSVDDFSPLLSCISTLCTGMTAGISIQSNSYEGSSGYPNVGGGQYTGPATIGGDSAQGWRFAHAIDIDPSAGDIGKSPPAPAWSDRLVPATGLSVSTYGTGGGLSAGTYCTVIVEEDAESFPGLTLPSNEVCQTVLATGYIDLQFTVQEYAGTAFRVYYGSTPGSEANYVRTTTPCGVTCTINFTTTSGASAGSPPTKGTAYLSALYRESNRSTSGIQSLLLGAGGTSTANLYFPLRIGNCTLAATSKVCVKDGLQADSYNLGANLLISATAPTVLAAGCGGSAASIPHANGTASFTVNVGTSNAGSCTITMPTAPHGWNCSATDQTTISTTVANTRCVTGGTTSITLANYSDIAGAQNWTDSDVIGVMASPY